MKQDQNPLAMKSGDEFPRLFEDPRVRLEAKISRLTRALEIAEKALLRIVSTREPWQTEGERLGMVQNALRDIEKARAGK